MTISALSLAGGAAVITCGDVPTGGIAALTVEGWYRVGSISQVNRPLLMKYGAGGHEWALYVTRDGRLYFVVFDASGVNAAYTLPGAVERGKLIHAAGCYDGTHCKVFVNGADVTFVSRISGGTVADTAQAAQIGGYIGDVGAGFVGRVGWQRVSDLCRYPVPTPLAWRGADQPPTVDGHTLGQWNISEGSGSTLDNVQGTAGYDGTISGGTWVISETSDKRRAAPARSGVFGRGWAQPVWARG